MFLNDGTFQPGSATAQAVNMRRAANHARRLGASCTALLLFGWACASLRFRDAENLLDGRFCLPAACGVALLVVGWAAENWRSFANWVALALVGQAAALQMIDAGPIVHYEHYKSLPRLASEPYSRLLLMCVALQVVLVGIGLKKRWASLRAWTRRNFRPRQLAGVALVFVLSSAAVKREFAVYTSDILMASAIQLVNLANMILAAWSLPDETVTRLRQKFGELLDVSPSISGKAVRADRFAVSAGLWVGALAAVLGYFSYQWHPHIPDEAAYLYHARTYAAGMFTMPAPPLPEAFSLNLMNYETNRWFSIFPPGWPALLAVGVWLGVPWLINPLLAGVNTLLVYLLVGDLYDRRTARFTTLLLCCSPWYVLMGMNLMSHTFTLNCALVGALALNRARTVDRRRWAVVAGVATGVASLIRPLDGFVLAILLGLWAIGLGGRRLKISSVAAFVVSAVAVGAVVLPYNALLTGSPMRFPVNVFFDKYYGAGSNAMGFGPGRGVGWNLDAYPGHSLFEALINANLNTFLVNIELLGWSTGSLLPIAVAVFCGKYRRGDYLMFAVIIAVFVAHIFYYFNGGPDFGARYWFLMLVPCAALAVRGVQQLEEKFADGVGRPSRHRPRLLIAASALCLLSLVNYFPWRAVDKYFHYWGMRPSIRVLAEKHRFEKSLVLVRGNAHPDYASAVIYNPLDLRADAPVYAWERTPEIRAQLLKIYADRPVWVVDAPSVTGRDYEVVAGPLAAQDMLAGHADGNSR